MDYSIHELLLLISAFIYGMIAVILYRSRHPHKSESKEFLPTVTVLVAMRNEEEYIEKCLLSLSRQNYPKELFKVLIIDDRSTDNSVSIAKQIIKHNENFEIIHIEEDRNNLKGKMNALAQGLQQVESEIVLITDADCLVPETWIRCHVSYYDTETGLVAGITSLSELKNTIPVNLNPTFFQKILSFDLLFLETIIARTSQINKPVTILGNNFGFRLETYRQTGGFEKIGYSITEDFVLMRAILKHTSFKVKNTIDIENSIFSYPVKNLRQFIQQRRRWILGAKNARPWGYFLMSIPYMFNILLILNIILGIAFPLLIASLIIRIVPDYFLIRNPLKTLHLGRLQKYFYLYQLFYFFSTLFFSVFFLTDKHAIWKNRKL